MQCTKCTIGHKKLYFYKINSASFINLHNAPKILQEIHTHCPTGPNQLKFPIFFYKHIPSQDSTRRTLAEVYNGWGPYAAGAAPHTHTIYIRLTMNKGICMVFPNHIWPYHISIIDQVTTVHSLIQSYSNAIIRMQNRFNKDKVLNIAT